MKQIQITGYRIEQAKPEDNYRECDARALVDQMGRMNLLAISGGRVIVAPEGVLLPIANGYWVTIHLTSADTYIVRRAYHRAGKTTWKQEWEDVYAEQVGAIAYEASLS
jgi:hypothetical protein